MHAWSEVEHDILYKRLGVEEATEAEQRMLDLMNGIVITGEVALQQLRSIIAPSNDNKVPVSDFEEIGTLMSQCLATQNFETCKC